jgi:ABC-type Fe3+/spermidine/putrescine transport system ATPase subunit
MHGGMSDKPLWTLGSVGLAPARLRDVSLEIHAGVTAVLGSSGAGKTSLLNVLVGFEKAARGIVAGPRRIFWVPQNGGLWPHCTAREHLRIVQPAGADIEAMLDTFDLAARADARPGELSEGERARLAVARALLVPADALVMDEPLAHVDSARVEKYWRAIRERLAATGTALVFATHEPERVLAEARRVIFIRDGAVLHAGDVAEFYADPPSRELMDALGPGNWLTPDEAKLWLGAACDRARCFRPEQIEIAPAHISPVVVRAANFRGAIAEAELHHLSAAAHARFFHRPADGNLPVGEPATIRLRA